MVHSHSIFILNVGISSFLNKGLHCVLMAFFNSNVQGSPLMERMRSTDSGCIIINSQNVIMHISAKTAIV